MWFYIYKRKCHIYKCGNMQISDTNGTLYEHNTRPHRKRGVRWSWPCGTRTPHTQTFGACALHACDIVKALRVRQLHFTNVRQLHFTMANVSVLLHLGDRKKIVAVPSNCADHYAFLCQTVVEWTGECVQYFE